MILDNKSIHMLTSVLYYLFNNKFSIVSGGTRSYQNQIRKS